ncbi:MAG TPA: hypothetical protein VGP63_02070 [Planctomycetaceae bacterium]|jgi:hypothetical protein|nr:hypothetical protein [Planctomycetaceae bacterium]
MTHRDWFGVLVRCFGLYLIIQALPQCVALMIEYQAGGPGLNGGGVAPMRFFGGGGGMLIYCLVYLVLGFIALRFANPIVRFAYPGEHNQWIPPIDDQPPAPHP